MSRWAEALRGSGGHPEAARQARILLLDTIGCALAARGHDMVRKAADAADALAGPGPATGLGSGKKRALLGAVLDSGAAIRALDFNDFYWGPGLGGHPSDMFAIALAVAEEQDRTIDEMIVAVIIGYEFYLRLLDLMESGPFDHATASALGGAAIASTLIGLDPERMAHALSFALLRGPSLAAVRYGAISEAKGLAAAIAGLNGVIAAQLAALGLSGPLTALEGERGVPAFLARGRDLGDLVPPSDAPLKVHAVVIKRFPSMGTSQASASAALALHERLQGRVERIRSLAIRLADSPLARHQITAPYRRPQNRETADHSFPAVIAMTLADGGLSPAQFERARYADADVLGLIDCMTFTCDLGGVTDGSYPAQIVATLDDATTQTVTVDHAPGHFRNPMDTATAMQKFSACASATLRPASIERVAKLCLDAAAPSRVRDLIASLQAEETT